MCLWIWSAPGKTPSVILAPSLHVCQPLSPHILPSKIWLWEDTITPLLPCISYLPTSEIQLLKAQSPLLPCISYLPTSEIQLLIEKALIRSTYELIDTRVLL